MISLPSDASKDQILSHYPLETHPLIVFFLERKIFELFDLRMILEQIDDLPSYLTMTLMDYLTISEYAGLHVAVVKARKPYFDFMASRHPDVEPMILSGEITAEGLLSDKIQSTLKQCGVMDEKGVVLPYVVKSRAIWSTLYE